MSMRRRRWFMRPHCQRSEASFTPLKLRKCSRRVRGVAQTYREPTIIYRDLVRSGAHPRLGPKKPVAVGGIVLAAFCSAFEIMAAAAPGPKYSDVVKEARAACPTGRPRARTLVLRSSRLPACPV